MPKPKETRRRAVEGPSIRASVKTYFDGGLISSDSGSFSGDGKQETVSEGHHWPNADSKRSLKDYGGDFRTIKSYVATPNTSSVKNSWPEVYNMSVSVPPLNRLSYTFRGQLYPVSFVGLTPPSAESSDSQLDALGATAIARCAPGSPPGDLFTALGELFKDGLPHLVGSTLWQQRTNAAKRAGEEYLNVQFGWQPLVSDITKFTGGVADYDRILSQYERDAGKVVRRTYRFPRVVTSRTEDLGSTRVPFAAVGYPGYFYGTNATGTLVRSVETTIDRWFSGAFTYYLPLGYDSRVKVLELARRADAVFGTSLTPETLWNLAPWSWAVDWFVNAGDVLKNVQRFSTGGLVMRYGYMMEHSITKWTYTMSRTGLVSGPRSLPPLVLVTEVKKRRQANPFGFGVSWDGLSPFQASILAALGITRSRR